MSKVIEACQ
jgi:regulator of telomere elongation helicase 1